MPLKTVMPMDLRAEAPAPVARTSGATPRMNANDVIRMGRKRARAENKIPLRVTALLVQAPSVLTARVEAGPVADAGELELYAALALNHAESNVSSGENSGRRLTHVGVVKTLSKIGKLAPGERFAQDVHLPIDAGSDARNLRLIVFAQQPGQGKIVGSAMQKLDH